VACPISGSSPLSTRRVTACPGRKVEYVAPASEREPEALVGRRPREHSHKARAAQAVSALCRKKPITERDPAAFDRCYSAGMWTMVLASHAAVVATSSLAISFLSYRSGGPRLSGNAEIHGRYDIQGPTLHVDVHNRGRGPITVDSVMLWGVGIALKKSLPVIGWPLRSPGCVLPSRIEGHSGEHWHFPGHDLAREWLNRDDLTRLEVEVGVATGKTLTLKVDTSNIDVLDGRNLPDWQPDYFKDWPKLPERQPPSDETSDRSPATWAEIKRSRTANELDL
jgi:hypothetical protein